jgi:phosphoglycerol geranylgeranyltransferase
LYPRYLQHTDAVAVGGSTAVTAANTEATFALLSATDRPVFHEPSDATHVTDHTRDAAAFIAIPQVLNGSIDAFVGELGAGIERVRDELAPSIVDDAVPSWTPSRVRTLLADAATSWLLETAVFEAYIVQNVESAAAREAGVTAADVLGPEEAARRATVAERYLHSPVVYVEYSGTFGGGAAETVLTAISAAVRRPRLWYGGGVASRRETRRMLDAGADAVVVGNAFHAVAEEEASLFVRATDALPADASRSRVEAWLSAEVDVPGSAATAYLSTVPSLASPVETAAELLADTVVTWLRLGSLSPRGSPSESAIEAVLLDSGNGASPGSTDPWLDAALSAVRGDDADPLARHLSPFDVPGDGTDGGTSDHV